MAKRSSMLASSVRALIAPVLLECPPRCGIAAITEVVVSSDDSYATVYVSVLQHPADLLAFLEERRGELQKKMGALGMRRTPQLRFRHDPRGDRAHHLDELLRKESE